MTARLNRIVVGMVGLGAILALHMAVETIAVMQVG